MSIIKKIMEKQLVHFLLLLVLLGGLVAASHLDYFFWGSLWGISTIKWLNALIIITVLHQVYVWFCWRLELYDRTLTSWFGRRAFNIYAIGFAILFLLRPLLITALAISNGGTLPSYRIINLSLSAILLIPSIYLGYSVARYFGLKRAFGIDHFEKSFRNKPMVKKGIFRFTSNGMYIYGFLFLWIPGIYFSSITAVIAALFSHLYIWIHYFCTEKPDMEHIYKK